jgi:hypothetical protein
VLSREVKREELDDGWEGIVMSEDVFPTLKNPSGYGGIPGISGTENKRVEVEDGCVGSRSWRLWMFSQVASEVGRRDDYVSPRGLRTWSWKKRPLEENLG